MKKSGLLNPTLVRAVARLGHTDMFVIADCGLPIPRSVEVIDLSLVFGVPRFAAVLDALMNEIVAEGAVAAEEVSGTEAEAWMLDKLPRLTYVPHEEFKRRVADAAFVVRSGETTPYANVMVKCGVPF